MSKLKLLVVVAVAHTLAHATAAAQTCLGLPGFSSRPVHVNLTGHFADDATVYAGGIGAGRANNLFANLGAGQISYKDMDATSTFGFLEFGYQVPIGRLQLCPIGGGSFGTGPDDDEAGLKVTSRGATAGASVGLPFALGGLSIVPNAALNYNYNSQEVSERDYASATTSLKATTLGLGLGFILRERIGIQPIVHVPLSGDERETSFGVFATVGFGWR